MKNLPRVSRVPRFLLAALALAAAAPCFAQNPATRSAADPAVAAAEARTVIPSVEWKQAAFTNVLADVEAKANKASPAGSPRFHIRLDEAVTNEIPAITMRASSIGLLPLLSMLADMTGLEHRIQEGQIVFGLPSAPAAGGDDEPWPESSVWRADEAEPSGVPFDPDAPGTIVHRQWTIRPSNRPDGLSASDNAEKWHDWFAEKGVAWPAGSSVSFFPTLGKLVVGNTRKNLDRLEAILKSASGSIPGRTD